MITHCSFPLKSSASSCATSRSFSFCLTLTSRGKYVFMNLEHGVSSRSLKGEKKSEVDGLHSRHIEVACEERG